uniref:LRRcap domain-containing protein n=1 Tax=Mesocestoides corti TaxID=53468 RepID=A0A5K3FD66_MESCO
MTSGVITEQMIQDAAILEVCQTPFNGDKLDSSAVKELTLEFKNICKIMSFCRLKNLTHLRLNNNCIKVMEGFEDLHNLEVLDLSFNKICKIEGIANLFNLKSLILSHNSINKVGNVLNHLKNLEILFLNENKLNDLTEIINLRNCYSLRSLKLCSNPLCSQEDYHYFILLFLPDLLYLDDKSCEAYDGDMTCGKYKIELRKLLEQEKLEAEKRASEYAKRDQQENDNAAFVKGLNESSLFLNSSLNRFDLAISHLPGVVEAFDEYPFLSTKG